MLRTVNMSRLIIISVLLNIVFASDPAEVNVTLHTSSPTDTLFPVREYLTLIGYLNSTTDEAVSFLRSSGYFDESSSSSALKQFSYNGDDDVQVRMALMEFQKRNNLHVSGELNEETVSLMRRRRCGVRDITSHNYILYPTKWIKKDINWYFTNGNSYHMDLTARAFKAWERRSGLRFYMNSTAYDILISFERKVHLRRTLYQTRCEQFDDKNIILGHAFAPPAAQMNGMRAVAEIHLNYDVPWNLDIKQDYGDENSFYNIILHEIGHSLGLSHSDNVNSVMYPFYSDENNDLAPDDIQGIQSLYGPPTPKSTTPTTSTSTEKTPAVFPTITITTTKGIPDVSPDLCEIENINKFVVLSNKRFYIIHEKWFWSVDLVTGKYEKPKLISDWFPFLPSNFKTVEAVYQDPTGDIVAVVDGRMYIISYPSMQLKVVQPLTSMLRFASHFHGMVNSYSGRTYVFYDDMLVNELTYHKNDNSFSSNIYGGRLSNYFPGVPTSVDYVFRYIDGLLYFFKDRTVYQFNEFSGVMEKALPNSLELFNIQCPTIGLLEQLKSVLKQLQDALNK